MTSRPPGDLLAGLSISNGTRRSVQAGSRRAARRPSRGDQGEDPARLARRQPSPGRRPGETVTMRGYFAIAAALPLATVAGAGLALSAAGLLGVGRFAAPHGRR